MQGGIGRNRGSKRRIRSIPGGSGPEIVSLILGLLVSSIGVTWLVLWFELHHHD